MVLENCYTFTRGEYIYIVNQLAYQMSPCNSVTSSTLAITAFIKSINNFLHGGFSVFLIVSMYMVLWHKLQNTLFSVCYVLECDLKCIYLNKTMFRMSYS